MKRNINPNRFLSNFKNRVKYQQYVKSIQKDLYSKVLEGEVSAWSQSLQDDEVFTIIGKEYIEYITEWVEKKIANEIGSKEALKINDYFFKQFTQLKNLCDELKIEESELINKLLGNKDFVEVGTKMGGVLARNTDSFWSVFNSEVSKDPSLRKKFTFSDLKTMYPKPENAALILNVAAIRTLNVYYLFQMESAGVIRMDNRLYDINKEDFFVRLTPKKVLKFKKRFTLDYKELLGNLYVKLTSGPIKFINDELTKLDDFIEVFTCDNLNMVDREIYFNVDRYQVSYILTHKLGFFYDSGFEKVIIESQKFLKKPFGEERPLPITNRDFSDYRSRYHGGTKKNSMKRLKNALIINAIFSEIR